MTLQRTSILLFALSLRAADIRAGSDELERFAASELERYSKLLFRMSPRTTFLIGSPRTNSEIARVLGGVAFPTSDEAYAIIPLPSRNTVVVGGGSPRASLWAVYDLVEQWGVRYLLHRDILPRHATYRLPIQPIRREPVLAIRQWRLVNELAFGPASWGLADYRSFIDQLAKLRFNRVLISLWAHQPFLRYAYGGIARRSSAMFFGQSRFDGRHFENPDIPASLDDQQRLDAGIAHVRGIMSYARGRGLEVVVSANITDFPKEFAPVLPDWRPLKQVGELTILPGPTTDLDDPNLAELSRTILHATFDTYPLADRVMLSVPEHRQWVTQYERAWKHLDGKYGLSSVASLDQLLVSATQRPDFHGGPERAQAEVKGDLVSLYLYDKLLSEERDRRFVFSSVAEELAPLLPKILPPNSELLSFIDYTPSRVLRRLSALRAVPASAIPSTLIYTLHDDNVGLLPQLATGAVAKLTEEITRDKWKGFSTRFWLIGDHDPAALYLSKAAWDQTITPEQVERDLAEAMCGKRCVPAMQEAYAALRHATEKLEWHGLGFAFPVEGMLMRHWSAKPLSAELLTVESDYRRALTAAARWDRYLAGRLSFGIFYLQAAREVQAGGSAEARGERVAARRHADAALRLLRLAIDAYAQVAQDRSDAGAIASLNEFALRPLREKVVAMN